MKIERLCNREVTLDDVVRAIGREQTQEAQVRV